MNKNEFMTNDKPDSSSNFSSRVPVAYALELHRIIEFEAYLRAEKDGFKCSPLDYWLAAEREVHQYF